MQLPVAGVDGRRGHDDFGGFLVACSAGGVCSAGVPLVFCERIVKALLLSSSLLLSPLLVLFLQVSAPLVAFTAVLPVLLLLLLQGVMLLLLLLCPEVSRPWLLAQMQACCSSAGQLHQVRGCMLTATIAISLVKVFAGRRSTQRRREMDRRQTQALPETQRGHNR